MFERINKNVIELLENDVFAFLEVVQPQYAVEVSKFIISCSQFSEGYLYQKLCKIGWLLTKLLKNKVGVLRQFSINP